MVDLPDAAGRRVRGRDSRAMYRAQRAVDVQAAPRTPRRRAARDRQRGRPARWLALALGLHGGTVRVRQLEPRFGGFAELRASGSDSRTPEHRRR